MYRVSALGGLFGADGGDIDADDVLKPFGCTIPDVVDNGHKNARCSSHPTSDIMLAFRKYGVTSRKNLTEIEKEKKPHSIIVSTFNFN